MVAIDGRVRGEWHDEAANRALIDAIKAHLDSSKVFLMEMDAHINDPAFADSAAQLLVRMMHEKTGQLSC